MKVKESKKILEYMIFAQVLTFSKSQPSPDLLTLIEVLIVILIIIIIIILWRKSRYSILKSQNLNKNVKF